MMSQGKKCVIQSSDSIVMMLQTMEDVFAATICIFAYKSWSNEAVPNVFVQYENRWNLLWWLRVESSNIYSSTWCKYILRFFEYVFSSIIPYFIDSPTKTYKSSIAK